MDGLPECNYCGRELKAKFIKEVGELVFCCCYIPHTFEYAAFKNLHICSFEQQIASSKLLPFIQVIQNLTFCLFVRNNFASINLSLGFK